MTKEQEDIKYLKESVCVYKNTIPKISEAIETVLNMLKEKDAEIEMYKDIKEIANYKVTDLAKLKKTDEIQEELDKKNKIIDLYIDELVAEEFDNPCTECCQECEKDKDTLESCIKQYFERKAEEN